MPAIESSVAGAGPEDRFERRTALGSGPLRADAGLAVLALPALLRDVNDGEVVGRISGRFSRWPMRWPITAGSCNWPSPSALAHIGSRSSRYRPRDAR